MLKEAALITVSCVLFVQMGLSQAIQDCIRVHFGIFSCPKCLTFWSVLAWLLFTGNGFLPAIAVSFLSAYSALWLALLYDTLAKLYNVCYEAITETHDTPADAEAPANDSETAADEVPKM